MGDCREARQTYGAGSVRCMGTGLGRPSGKGGLICYQGTVGVGHAEEQEGAGSMAGFKKGSRFLAKYGASVRGGRDYYTFCYACMEEQRWREEGRAEEEELKMSPASTASAITKIPL